MKNLPLWMMSVLGVLTLAVAPLASAQTKAPSPAPGVDATGWTTPRPPYPDELRKEHPAGSVRIRVFTDWRGHVKKAVVLQSSGHKELDDATVKFALANWRGPRQTQAVYVQTYHYGR